MKIAFVTSEAAPFAKTGGLADVTSALAQTLRARGHDVRLFLPLYGGIGAGHATLRAPEALRQILIPTAARTLEVTAFESQLPGADVPAYRLHCPVLFDRPTLYTADPDEPLRFAVLCRAALECCQRLSWSPDIVHGHDWHAALLPLYLKTVYAWDRLFEPTRTVLTIHNLGYQGVFDARVLGRIGLEGSEHLLDAAELKAGRIGFLRTGIVHAHLLTTVSPTYAREIQDPEHGFGLHALLASRRNDLVGILNGVDYSIWNPEIDPHIARRYSHATLADKESNREALLLALGLPFDPVAPVFGVVTRLAYQKGIELILEALPDVLARRAARFVLLGEGEARYADALRALETAFPDRVRFQNGHDEGLAHRIEAGADFFLMPSRYEPCGLNQMYSLRYGAVPVVRRTGGLADSVRPFVRPDGDGTGFVFDTFTSTALRAAMELAIETFGDPAALARVRRNGMTQDFSWDRQVAHYEAAYARAASRA